MSLSESANSTSLIMADVRLRNGMSIGQNRHLYVGQCDTVELAETYGTPLFVYDEDQLRKTIQKFHEAFRETGCRYEITYASKAFCTIAMCQLAFSEGCSIDVVSGGELYTALAAGVDPAKIRFHGNNKTEDELIYALSSGVGVIIVDNEHEMQLLNQVALSQQKIVDIVLRISPGVEAHTHEFISTGQQDSKFGFDLASGQVETAIRMVAEYANLRCIGVHAHIGSQIFETQGFILAIERLASVYEYGVKQGLPFGVLDVGGGFGIRYTEEDDPLDIHVQLRTIVDTVRVAFDARQLAEPEIWIEPGRSIVGPAGMTLYRVGSQKTIPNVRNYVAIDGGMTDNPRLALYGAKYEAMMVNRATDAVEGAWSVAGKCCESGDMVIWDAPLPTPQAGDILGVFATGAYNYSMASHYNRIPNPAVVFVKNGDAKVVVERETWADTARLDKSL